MNSDYLKASTEGLPEGTDWSTLFEFSQNENFVDRTLPQRCIDVDGRCDGKLYQAITRGWYLYMRPVEKWQPEKGQLVVMWNEANPCLLVGEYLGQSPDKGFLVSSGTGGKILRWHVANAEKMTRVPRNVEEAKDLSNGEWL